MVAEKTSGINWKINVRPIHLVKSFRSDLSQRTRNQGRMTSATWGFMVIKTPAATAFQPPAGKNAASHMKNRSSWPVSRLNNTGLKNSHTHDRRFRRMRRKVDKQKMMFTPLQMAKDGSKGSTAKIANASAVTGGYFEISTA